MSAGAGTAVIGFGNVVLSDDGLGIHAITRLRKRYAVGRDTLLVEGGTAGMLLLPHLTDARRAILVDAVDCRAAPGSLVRMELDDRADAFSTGMTPHEVGLRDLLAAARLIGAWPQQLVLYGLQPRSTAVGTDLTPPVAAALDALVDGIAAQLSAWTPRGSVEKQCDNTSRTGYDHREEDHPWKPHTTQPRHGRTQSVL